MNSRYISKIGIPLATLALGAMVGLGFSRCGKDDYVPKPDHQITYQLKDPQLYNALIVGNGIHQKLVSRSSGRSNYFPEGHYKVILPDIKGKNISGLEILLDIPRDGKDPSKSIDIYLSHEQKYNVSHFAGIRNSPEVRKKLACNNFWQKWMASDAYDIIGLQEKKPVPKPQPVVPLPEEPEIIPKAPEPAPQPAPIVPKPIPEQIKPVPKQPEQKKIIPREQKPIELRDIKPKQRDEKFDPRCPRPKYPGMPRYF